MNRSKQSEDSEKNHEIIPANFGFVKSYIIRGEKTYSYVEGKYNYEF